MADAEAGIGTRTLKGMAWAYGSYVGGRLLVLVSTAILARVLTPADFGLVALALITIALLEMVADLGLGQALVISRREDLRERADTVFTFSVALGALLSLTVAALSPLAALVFDEPQLTTILPILGLNFFLRSLGSTHNALAQKELDFRTRTIAEMADVILRGVVSVVLALAGAGVYSIVVGYVLGTVTLVSALWIQMDWRPRLSWDTAIARKLLGFGGTLSAVDVVAAVISNVDYVFIGTTLGTTALGLYTLGFRIPELLIINLATVAGKVLFPAFAAVDRRDLGAAFLVSLRYMVLLGLPTAAGLAVLAGPLTITAFGPQWTGAIDAMRVLTLFAFCVTLGIPAGTAYKATGRAGILLKLAIPRALLAVASIAVFVDEGIVAVAACQAAVAGLFALIGIGLASRLLGVGGRSIWSAIWPALVAAGAVVLVTYPIQGALGNTLVALVAGGAAGTAAYAAVLWLVARDAVLDFVRRMRGRAPDAVPDLPAARETDVIA